MLYTTDINLLARTLKNKACTLIRITYAQQNARPDATWCQSKQFRVSSDGKKPPPCQGMETLIGSYTHCRAAQQTLSTEAMRRHPGRYLMVEKMGLPLQTISTSDGTGVGNAHHGQEKMGSAYYYRQEVIGTACHGRKPSTMDKKMGNTNHRRKEPQNNIGTQYTPCIKHFGSQTNQEDSRISCSLGTSMYY